MRVDPPGYGYDDVILEPQFSDLGSRADPFIGPLNLAFRLDIPIISSPMDTVTEEEMAIFMARKGGLGIIHRYMSIEDQVMKVEKVRERFFVGASVGANDSLERIYALIAAGADLLAVDVAHGDSEVVYNTIRRIKDASPKTYVLSGNIATADGAERADKAGADAIRVGIGAGSACTTRLVAGVGVPQLTAILRASEGTRKPIVADGGIKHSGDIVKAIAAGADAVMVGSLFAGYPVTPRPGSYRGMASYEALSLYKGTKSVTVEGEAFDVPIRSDFEDHFDGIIRGIRQGFAYLGAGNQVELRRRAKFVQVTSLGHQEGEAHLGNRIRHEKIQANEEQAWIHEAGTATSSYS